MSELEVTGVCAPIALPGKPTCTVAEAAACIGISARQIRYWVEEGTLLALNSAREPVAKRRKGGKLDRWRIVVRRSAEGAAARTGAGGTFLSLEELVVRILNVNAE